MDNRYYFKSSVLAAGLGAALVLTSSAPGHEKWPAPTPEAKREAEETRRYEEDMRKRLEPEINAWAKKGKPYIPSAAVPGDLPQASVPAFPGAEGAGKFSFGGRGGKVYIVSNLNDSGPGTLRQACEAAGPRIVVFNVSGIIQLKQRLSILAPYLTIAGQTAPGDGICVAGRSFLVSTHDVVIRYVRFRRGGTNVFDRDDALGGNPVGNVIVDHCSASWGFDENLSMYRHMYDPRNGQPEQKLPVVNITIQWCISSEALDTYNHAFGGTWGGRNTSFHHNLFASNTGRNPSIGMSYDFNFINNVLFNWRHRTVDGGDDLSFFNCINNYYRPGPKTPDGAIRCRVLLPAARRTKTDPTPRYGKAYVAGNFVEGNEKVSADNWAGGVQFKDGGTEEDPQTPAREETQRLIRQVRSDKPFPMAPVATQTAREAFDSVLANAGANLPRRDPVDARIIEEVKTGKVTYQAGDGIITDIQQVGGYPQYQGTPATDLGSDGIPLWWKKQYGLNADDTSLATKDLKGDGYSVIEKYLNGLDPTKKITWDNPASHLNTLTADKFSPMRQAARNAAPKF